MRHGIEELAVPTNPVERNGKMGKTIQDLPNELLTAIFHRVHASSHTRLISCIGCCQLWKDLAEPILWRNIFLRFQNSQRFSAQVVALSQNEEGRRKLETVRCLRIAVPGNGRDYAGGVQDGFIGEEDASGGVRIWNARSEVEVDVLADADQFRSIVRRIRADSLMRVGIYALQYAVPLLSSLTTFHLLVYNGVKMNGPDDMLGTIGHRGKTEGPDPDMFVGLIDRLPPTVRDLCLDMSDATRKFPHQECQFCPAINRILPGVEHLALYLRTCCDCVLLSTISSGLNCSNLKSIIMRLQGFQSKVCRSSGRQQQSFDLNGYCRRVQNARSTGAFPNLESFLIISKRRLAGASSQNLSCRWAVYVKDMTSDQTVVFPRVFLEKPYAIPQGVTRTYSPRALIRIPENCSFLPAWLLGNEYVGGSGGIRRLCEGLAGWEAFRSGPIIPRLRVRDVQTAVDQGYIKRWYEPETSDYFRKRSPMSCDLWEEEEAAGVRLIEPMVYSGVTTDILLAKRVVQSSTNLVSN